MSLINGGCCWRFKFEPEEIEQRSRSRQIDKVLEKERKDRRKQVGFKKK
jgi:guanine nucleotide-binding protein subunit alpha-12